MRTIEGIESVLHEPAGFAPRLVVVPGVRVEPGPEGWQPQHGFDGYGVLAGDARIQGVGGRYLKELEYVDSSNSPNGRRPAHYLITGGETNGRAAVEAEVCVAALHRYLDDRVRRSPHYRRLIERHGMPDVATEHASACTSDGVRAGLLFAMERGETTVEFASNFYHWARLSLMVDVTKRHLGLDAIAVRVTATESYAEAVDPRQRGVNSAAYNSLSGRLRLMSEVKGVIGLLADSYGDPIARRITDKRVKDHDLICRAMALIKGHRTPGAVAPNPELMAYIAVCQVAAKAIIDGERAS